MTSPSTRSPVDDPRATHSSSTRTAVRSSATLPAIGRHRRAVAVAPAPVLVPPTSRGPGPAGPPVGSRLGGPVADPGAVAALADRETHHGPDGGEDGHVRAAVAVLLGRGDRVEPFELLADRLALDGYLATVVPDGGNRAPAVAEIRVPGVPFVLLGSDTGALAALSMAASPAVRPDGVVLLGLPLLHVPVAGVAIEEPSPRALPDLPILLVHGEQDEISPLSLVRMTTRTASRADLAVVPGGHDVLTGPGRRCVAARTLLFLESLLDG